MGKSIIGYLSEINTMPPTRLPQPVINYMKKDPNFVDEVNDNLNNLSTVAVLRNRSYRKPQPPKPGMIKPPMVRPIQ